MAAVVDSGVRGAEAGLAASIDEALRDAGLDPRCLRLEITESVVMSNAVHAYISQSDKGELVIGAGTDQYVSYSQRGGLPLIEHTTTQRQ